MKVRPYCFDKTEKEMTEKEMTEKEKYINIWNNLNSSVDANLQFAKLVITQEPNNTKYFFGDYSYEIIKWIAATIFNAKAKDLDNFIYKLYGDYFEFVANPINEFNLPQWYQLKSYKGLNNMKLKSWLMKNSHQFFARKKKNEERKAFAENEMIDFVDYEALLGLGKSTDNMSDKDCVYQECLKKAWAKLSDKDRNVLTHLILEKMYWEDAFEELKELINPREGKQVMESWSDKRKQDALAMMKIRAVQHLTKRFNQLKA